MNAAPSKLHDDAGLHSSRFFEVCYKLGDGARALVKCPRRPVLNSHFSMPAAAPLGAATSCRVAISRVVACSLQSGRMTRLRRCGQSALDQTAANFFDDQDHKHPYKRRELEEIDQRFEAFPDPVNNWIVWDRIEDDYAEVGTHRLRSLSEAQAKAFCFLLNRLLS